MSVVRVRKSFAILTLALALLSGSAIGIQLTRATLLINDYPFAPGMLWDAAPPLSVSGLTDILGSRPQGGDAETVDRIVAYYRQNAPLLQARFQEANPERAAALWVMYVIHNSHLYGAHDPDASLVTWLYDQPYADCSSYAHFQSVLLSALNLPWRRIEISGGTHTFIEVQIDGRWELFDATVNEWVDRSAFELERGNARSFRAFYSRMDDPSTTGAYQPTMRSGNQALRQSMIGIGLYWFPKAVFFIADQSPEFDAARIDPSGVLN